MPRRVGDWLARAVTSDKSGLIALGATSIVRAYSYMPGNINPDRLPAHWLEAIMPPTSWAWVWLTLGILAITSAVLPRLMPLAVGLIVALHAMWAISFMTIQIFGPNTRAYVSALGYFTVAWLAAWGFGRRRTHQPSPEVS